MVTPATRSTEKYSALRNTIVAEEFASVGGVQETDLHPRDHQFSIQGDSEAIADSRHYQVIVERAIDVFGDAIKASRWLSTPSADFDGKTPLLAVEDSGYNLSALEPVFIAIEHRIY